MLLTGSLIFVEQSGYNTLLSDTLRPFVHYVPFYSHWPEELVDVYQWAKAHPAQAKAIAAAGQAWAQRFLSDAALDCRWHLLLREYTQLLRFDPNAVEFEVGRNATHKE